MRLRAVAAVIRENAILMVHHQHEGRSYWTLPGGGVEQGETPAQAAVRELNEETGLRATVAGELYQSAHEICFLMDTENNHEPQTGYDPELDPLDQMLTAVAWKRLEEFAADIQVSQVIEALRTN